MIFWRLSEYLRPEVREALDDSGLVRRGLRGIHLERLLANQLIDERPDGWRVLNNLTDSLSVVEMVLGDIHEGVDVEVFWHWLFSCDENMEGAVGQLNDLDGGISLSNHHGGIMDNALGARGEPVCVHFV